MSLWNILFGWEPEPEKEADEDPPLPEAPERDQPVEGFEERFGEDAQTEALGLAMEHEEDSDIITDTDDRWENEAEKEDDEEETENTYSPYELEETEEDDEYDDH